MATRLSSRDLLSKPWNGWFVTFGLKGYILASLVEDWGSPKPSRTLSNWNFWLLQRKIRAQFMFTSLRWVVVWDLGNAAQSALSFEKPRDPKSQITERSTGLVCFTSTRKPSSNSPWNSTQKNGIVEYNRSCAGLMDESATKPSPLVLILDNKGRRRVNT